MRIPLIHPKPTYPIACHIDDNRPTIEKCRCGKELKGSSSKMSADAVFYCDGRVLCERCAWKWFYKKFCISDVI